MSRSSNGADAVAPAMQAEAAGPTADRLKSFFERIERLDEERGAIGTDIKDVFSEAKGIGYDIKTMRKVLALRKLDPADRAEQETLIDTYMHELGMIDRVEARIAEGATIRGAAKAEGMPKSTAIRRVTQNRHIAANGSVDVVTSPAEGINLKPKPACISPRPATWQQITLARDAFEAEREAAKEAERARRRAEHKKVADWNAVIDADPLTVPPFLRRVA